jgi:hypothetical protein
MTYNGATAITVLTFLTIFALPAKKSAADEIDSLYIQAVNQVHHCNYADAIEISETLRNKFPEDAAWIFLKLYTYNTIMDTFMLTAMKPNSTA